jgi:hypothetical protein
MLTDQTPLHVIGPVVLFLYCLGRLAASLAI